jgi:hypothetical protein
MAAAQKPKTFQCDPAKSPPDISAGLKEVIAERPQRFASGKKAASGATKLEFRRVEKPTASVSVKWHDGVATVEYSRTNLAFRALGRLLGGAGDFSESTNFTLLGAMIDVSRNGVLRPDTAKAILRRFALMGLNMCLLYAEDTYEVPGEPFFGYLRGRYSQDELRDLDSYAAHFGIEMFPCIQALGHLEQILQWPAYKSHQDVTGVLIAEEEPTYALLEKMIVAASTPFRSKRIHIGMDEAHGIGTGKYKQLHGEKRPFDVLNTHLNRVRAICSKHGLKPMIWSDMFFRLGSKSNDYYDMQWDIPADVVKNIPKDVGLVYWDYYHTDHKFYEEWIDRHRKLGSDPLMAGGVWTWNHLWAALPWSFNITQACMKACKSRNLREVFTTMWGDDGMECDIFSALPGTQYFAEHAFHDTIDEQALRANFKGSCDADYDDFVAASGIDSVPLIKKPEETPANVSKWLLYQDPLLAIMDPCIGETSLRKHYETLAKKLDAAAKKTPDAQRLKFPAQIARVLALKCDLRRTLAAAYKKGDRKKLAAIAKGDLAKLRREVTELWKIHRRMWLETYKPFGLEVVENRYGGLMARLETLQHRLIIYARYPQYDIPELEVELLPAVEHMPGHLPHINHDRVKTPSIIK